MTREASCEPRRRARGRVRGDEHAGVLRAKTAGVRRIRSRRLEPAGALGRGRPPTGPRDFVLEFGTEVFGRLLDARRDARAYVRNARNTASLDLPALGLAKPSIEDFSDELINLTSTRTDRSVGRVLPDGGDDECVRSEWRLARVVWRSCFCCGVHAPSREVLRDHAVRVQVVRRSDRAHALRVCGDTLAVGADHRRRRRCHSHRRRAWRRMADGTMPLRRIPVRRRRSRACSRPRSGGTRAF